MLLTQKSIQSNGTTEVYHRQGPRKGKNRVTESRMTIQNDCFMSNYQN